MVALVVACVAFPCCLRSGGGGCCCLCCLCVVVVACVFVVVSAEFVCCVICCTSAVSVATCCFNCSMVLMYSAFSSSICAIIVSEGDGDGVGERDGRDCSCDGLVRARSRVRDELFRYCCMAGLSGVWFGRSSRLCMSSVLICTCAR